MPGLWLSSGVMLNNIETFPDGSYIETNPETLNRTVCGVLAHAEYFKRLQAERITANMDYAVMAFCRDVDGTRKAELIRRRTNPFLLSTFGEFSWEVWSSADPDNVTRCNCYEQAAKLFQTTMLNGTNV